MSYTSQGLIEATDYNNFVNNGSPNINGFWASGSTDSGWGQTAIPTVVANNPAVPVSATQWATLVNNLSAAGAHTGTTITSRIAPVANTLISVLANVSTDITNINTNRLNAVASGSQSTSFTGNAAKTTNTSGTNWSITFTSTVAWANSDAARYFFNAGGRVKLETSKSSIGDTGDPEWNDLATTLMSDLFFTAGTGTQTIAGTSYTGTTRSGGTGTPTTNASTTGWYDITAGAAATTVYQQAADTAPYTGNYIRVNLAKNSVGNVLTITTIFQNSDSDPITGGTDVSGITPGTAPCAIVSVFPPSTTNLSNSWGAATITSSVA
jgi:hypothetical protein